jgi:hypothetical protein
MDSRIVRLSAGFFLFAVSAFMSGCGSGTTIVEPTIPPSESQRRLNAIGDAYLRSTMRLNRSPKSVQEITQGLKDQGLKPEDVLKSPDDGQPFEIVWGTDLRGMKATGSDVPIIAFERTGKDGKRHVLRGRSEIVLMSESEIRSGKFPDGYQPPF